MAACFDTDSFNASTNRVALPAVLVFCKGSSPSHASRDTNNFLLEKGWQVVKEVFKRNRVGIIVGTAKDALMMARALGVSAEKEQSLVACFGDLGYKEETLLVGSCVNREPKDKIPCKGREYASITKEILIDFSKSSQKHPICALNVYEWLYGRSNNGERSLKECKDKLSSLHMSGMNDYSCGHYHLSTYGLKTVCLQSRTQKAEAIRQLFVDLSHTIEQLQDGNSKGHDGLNEVERRVVAKTMGQIHAKHCEDFVESLVKHVAATKSPEQVVRDRLASELHGNVEVTCKGGRIDILTSDYVVEVKVGHHWSHALGQVLVYGASYPKKRKRVHLFDVEDIDVDFAKEICASHDVEVSVEP